MLPILLVVLCVVFRIVPHPPNFAPVGASAVLAGRTLRTGPALAVVVVAMGAGDLVLARIHGYPVATGVTPFVYGGLLVQALLGRGLRSRKGGAIAAALLGSLFFFALSNLGVWIASGMYPHTGSGLAGCYAAALPFLRATVLGDLTWTLILSVAYRRAAVRLEGRRAWVPVPTREIGVV